MASGSLRRRLLQRELPGFVVYDIENDRARTKIFEACRDYGLDPVQFSVFCGTLSPNRWEELFLRIGRELGDGDGYILVIQLCEKDFKKIRKTGAPIGIGQIPVASFE
jgi:CRISPR-associated protein Cas2